MPYRTPQELPEEDDCRPLFIPADSEWLALFGGALTELLKTWNWEYSGGLTVDETIDKMTDIINNWYSVACVTCETPGGYRIIRINELGLPQELNDDGEWQDPTGDYVLSPPAAREGGTADDQICLAAKNAVNVLHELYSSISDSFNDGLTEAEALTALIALIISILGAEFAVITWAIAAFFLAVFSALYTSLRYIFADLWDDAVSDQITCFLVDCATNTDGVVTFDYPCFTDHLNSLADSFGLSEVQLRLYAQIGYLLYFIGGEPGLNLAGATTAIDDDDCSMCDTWCYTWNFLHESWAGDGFEIAPGFSGYGEWIDSNGWYGAPSPDPTPGLVLSLQGIPDVDITRVTIHGKMIGGSGRLVDTFFRSGGVTLSHPDMALSFAAGGEVYDANIEGTWNVDELWFNPVAGTSSQQYIFNITLYGSGTNPFGDDNC